MNETNIFTRQQLHAALRELPPAAVASLCLAIDGHTGLYAVQTLVDGGWPTAIEALQRPHASHPTNPKFKITDITGDPIDISVSVYGLSILMSVCEAFEISHHGGMYQGRGRKARAMQEAIVAWAARATKGGACRDDPK